MKLAAALFALAAGAVACGDNLSPITQDPDAPPQPDAPPAEPDAPPQVTGTCTSSITATAGEYVELCDPDAPVRHVRIAGVQAPATHASAQLFLGFDAPPTAAQGDLEADQFKIMLYGGGAPQPPPVVQAVFGDVALTLEGDTAFVNQTSTICFDITDGGATSAPGFVLWVDGQRGASCADPATLTLASAFASRALWRGKLGALDKAAKLYFRQSPGVTATPTITLLDQPVLAESAIRTAATCSSTHPGTPDWFAFCATPAGEPRHVRIQGVHQTANNSYWYAVLGEVAAPAGNPVAGDGKLIITGGRSSGGASWTYFRFNNGSTLPAFEYQNDAGALYVAAPTDVCFDVGTTAMGHARVLFWATGAGGASCADTRTLTAANALYDSTTDTATGAIWNAALVEGASFTKVNNATSAIGTVTVSAEAAVL